MVITPGTWTSAKHFLQSTSTGLYDLVGWFGSTHAEAEWRKDDNFLDIFEDGHIHGFDPQIDDWAPSYATIEAEVLAQASVITIRLENNELVNGSLGAIAEIGMALTSAALRGQVVIVSIEDGLLTSLTEPGSIAQYMIIEMFLEQWEHSPELAGLLHIHRGDNLHDLAGLTCRAAEQQMAAPQHRLDFNKFLEKKERRKHNFPMRVVMGGSGGPYSDAYQPTFEQKKQALLGPYQAEGQVLKVLSEGAIAEAWQIPYSRADHIEVALATRTLLSIESEYKREADVLLLPLVTESASKGAATEIGLLLLSALTTGQSVKIYLEPFDPVDFLKHQLERVGVDTHNGGERDKRMALREAGVGSNLLATAVKSEIEETFELVQQLMCSAPPPYKQIKASLLGKTPAFSNADNIRRVRSLVQAHLEALYYDERFPDFFSYSNRIEV